MLTTNELLRREWTGFRRPGRLVVMAAAALVLLALGLFYAFGNHASCDGPCATDPTGPNGSPVSDQFYFTHRDLPENGSITVRMTSMTGTITYPPPHHDQIVPGLVPWAKAGIIIKDGVRQGSSYAALMLTGSHGVRMQYDYGHDIAGSGGGVSAQSPRWLRLTRSGDTVTGDESADGKLWAKVGTAKLSGLPGTVQVGMFAASPGDLTLRRVGLGGATEQVRFTQAVGAFDNISLEGATAAGGWKGEAVGEMNRSDWEKHHKASGAVEEGGTITVAGIGDIGPTGTAGTRPVERALGGLSLALLIVLVVAVRFATSEYHREPAGGAPPVRRVFLARAAIVGAATFVTGLLSVAVVIPVGTMILKGNGVAVIGISTLTGVRVATGVAAALALSTVLAFALGSVLRRGLPAILLAVSAIVVPYVVTTLPLLPDGLSQWLLRITPAAGFAAQQTLVAYPQVVAHYAPSAGYFPLPWWAGIAVLCAYTVIVVALALRRLPRSDGQSDRAERTEQTADWR
ncbi:hypothetical protein J7F03_39795 [Streptomyces sp. ISL-43]|uniref:hypothetical protein n=1 Tax=Streptomyces sp. ISL-43 TaxID=2819183 RepID=UPI001BE8EAF3|nr:hypothetical protein [Streptomyces sp. ISL-43]MBT2453063.1 hypothetical protein [Streptomyces sp. ISL-43]